MDDCKLKGLWKTSKDNCSYIISQLVTGNKDQHEW